MRKILVVFGTRPEAIKLCPLIRRLRKTPSLETVTCVTGQHNEMLTQVLDVFDIHPEYNLGVMTSGQTLFQSTSRIISALESVLEAENPHLVIVQGDTTTTFCGALAAFYRNIPLAHVEAGLRTGDILQPFPEEVNRSLTSKLATLHFAATDWAATNLFNEGVDPSAIFVTGNTAIDAVLETCDRLESGELTAPALPHLDPRKKLIVVTAHRRENFGDGLDRICSAIEFLANRGDVQIVSPVHPNPAVQSVVYDRLAHRENILLTPPLDYVSFVDLMRQSDLILTDSGGIQEEAPSLGKPVLVLRDKTERPEAVVAGTVVLVGTDPAKIVSEASLLLGDPAIYEARSRRHNPYGDGQACRRITAEIQAYLGVRSRIAGAS